MTSPHIEAAADLLKNADRTLRDARKAGITEVLVSAVEVTAKTAQVAQAHALVAIADAAERLVLLTRKQVEEGEPVLCPHGALLCHYCLTDKIAERMANK